MLENFGNRVVSSLLVAVIVFVVAALIFWVITLLAGVLPFNWIAISIAVGVLSGIGYFCSRKVLF